VTYDIFDDQGPVLWGSYVGNWTHYTDSDFYNDTVTITTTSGASLSFTFAGSQAWLYGALLNTTNANGQVTSYPTVEYLIDDSPAGSQTPWVDDNGGLVLFQTPKLADGTHEIDITVKGANETNQFIMDYFLVTPLAGADGSGVVTTRSGPSPTPSPTQSSSSPTVVTTSTPVGAIVGGVVGGIAGIAILAAAVWYFLHKRTRGGQAYYFDKPNPGDILAAEAHVEPSNGTATTPVPSSTVFPGPIRQSTYSDGSSNQPLNRPASSNPTSRWSVSGHTDGDINHVSGISAQPRTGKAALVAQQQNALQPIQYEDSGIRFNENAENAEQEPGPSQIPHEVPPSYTPN